MEIFHVLFATKKVTLKVIALQLVFTLALFACVYVERKGIYKGFETGKAIKSLAFTFTVQLTKNVARLGAAEVPADRGTFFLSRFL